MMPDRGDQRRSCIPICSRPMARKRRSASPPSALTGKPVIKAIKVKDAADIASGRRLCRQGRDHALRCQGAGDAGGALPGGNGLAFDWSLLAGTEARPAFILSGGLNPENVAAAIRVTGAPSSMSLRGSKARPASRTSA